MKIKAKDILAIKVSDDEKAFENDKKIRDLEEKMSQMLPNAESHMRDMISTMEKVMKGDVDWERIGEEPISPEFADGMKQGIEFALNVLKQYTE